MNSWGIPSDQEERLRARDLHCVYCRVRMKEHAAPGSSRKLVATWEHINNDRWDDNSIMEFNVVRCCGACNSSKGSKRLLAWFESSYCKDKGITAGPWTFR